MIIREATPTDAPRIAELSGIPGYPTTTDAIAGRLARLLTRAEDIVLVAEEMPRGSVGWLHGTEQELLDSGRRCDITGLVVDPEQRGHGVGRQLVAALEAWAIARETQPAYRKQLS